MDVTESMYATMYTIGSFIFEDRVAALKAFSFILENVDQMHFRFERKDGKIFIVYDPSMEPHVQAFPKEIPDFLELRSGVIFKDESVAMELRMYGEKQVVLIGSHSICDGKFLQQVIDSIQHKGSVDHGMTQSYVDELGPSEITNCVVPHTVRPNKFKVLRQFEMDIPVE